MQMQIPRPRLGMTNLILCYPFAVVCLESPARVAKLADARDLKSRVLNGTCRFNSGPGHQQPDPSTPARYARVRSGFRHAAQTPRKRLNLKSRVLNGTCRF